MSANGSQIPIETLLTARIEKLENDLAQVIWLHAELIYALRLATAQAYVQQMGPAVQQQLVDQIMSGVT